MKYNILIVDDDQVTHTAIKSYLDSDKFNFISAYQANEAFTQLNQENIHLIISDVIMPSMTGIEFLKKMKEMNMDLPVIIVSATDSAKNAVECLKLGAYDYILKPFEPDTILFTVSKVIEKISLSSELRELKKILKQQNIKKDMIGNTRYMDEIFKKMLLVANSDSTVLITGESGTGKEMLAEGIHKNSNRSDRPLLKINCAAIPAELLENELFGHEKGAYTGAHSHKDGLFLKANLGTILLDEIGEIPLTTQAKLLRVLQNQEFIPIGSTETIKVNVRVIAITNKILEELVKSGSFRSDLFYRLNVISIIMPTLRERREDIPLLSSHFLKIYSNREKKVVHGFSSDCIQKMMRYNWPGNVRELQNIVESAVVLTTHKTIHGDDIMLPKDSIPSEDSASPSSPQSFRPYREAKNEFEKSYLIRALEIAEGNISLASKISGIDRKGFYNFITKYQVNINSIRKRK